MPLSVDSNDYGSGRDVGEWLAASLIYFSGETPPITVCLTATRPRLDAAARRADGDGRAPPERAFRRPPLAANADGTPDWDIIFDIPRLSNGRNRPGCDRFKAS